MKRISDATRPSIEVGDNGVGVMVEKTDDLYKIGTKDGKVDKLYCR